MEPKHNRFLFNLLLKVTFPKSATAKPTARTLCAISVDYREITVNKNMDTEKPKYGVFIIESMDFENESKGKLDGYALKVILDLCGIPNDYYYIRTKLEFEQLVSEFENSEYGFLHIACHGNEKELVLTYDTVEFSELDSILGDALYHRRLFLSACKVAVFELAEYFIPKYHCYSIIGTPDDLDYDKAAIFWSSFYYLMFSNDQEQMFQVDILPTLLIVSNTFKVKLNYFSIINNNNTKSIDHLREICIENGNKTNDQAKLTRFKNQFRTTDFDNSIHNIQTLKS